MFDPDRLAPPLSAALPNALHWAQLGKVGPTVDYASSSIEAPSAILALGETLRAIGPTKLRVSVANVDAVDPRAPRGPTQYPTWTYANADGQLAFVARPAASAPRASVVEAIGRLANAPAVPEEWLASAQRVGAELGVDHLADLIAVTMHAPPRPRDVWPWDWIFRVQVAAALAITGIESSGWQGTKRRDGLLSLLNGPVDWTASAAIVAMATLARDGRSKPDIPTKDGMGILPDLFATITASIGNPCARVCVLEPAVACLLRDPCLPEQARNNFLVIQRDVLGG